MFKWKLCCRRNGIPERFSLDGLARRAEITEDDREAAQDYAEALTILRTLLAKDARYKFSLATALVGVAVFDRGQGRVGKAQQEYAEAETIFATALVDEGYLEHDRGRMNTARTKYLEALQICRELVAEHQEFRDLLACALYDQAMLDRDVHKASSALVEATESVSIYENLASGHPKRFASDLDAAKKLRDGLVKRAGSAASP
jgi:tetratricopeptide (TPR) repeat protein